LGLRVAGSLEGGHADLVHPEVVGVGVAPLVVAVDDHDLGPVGPDGLHQSAHGLVVVGPSEAPGILVGRRVGHARVPVTQQDEVVVADDLHGRGQFLEADLG
jgi:hypothetical protein